MKKDKYDFSEIDELFESSMQEATEEMHFTSSRRIVDERIRALDENIALFKSFKYQAIQRESEYHANSFLYMQCVAQAIRAIFVMFRFVRNDENLKAWSSLIDAFEYLDVALIVVHTIHKEPPQEALSGVASLRERFVEFEKGLFPAHKIYNSPGMIEGVGDCSICGESFLVCEHVEKGVYAGRFCTRVNRKPIEFEHFAVVTEPRDRRCIFTTKHNRSGQSVDVFSREPLEQQKEEGVYEAIMFQLGELDIN